MKRNLLALVALLAVLAASAPAAGELLAPIRISTDAFGADVPGSHATEVEPSAAAWGSAIVAAFQVGRNFGGGASAIGFATSKDGARTWQNGSLPGLTTWAPAPGPAARASDPAVAYDAVHGRWLVATLSSSFGIAVSTSPDGLTWGAPKTTAASGGLLDKEWLACDNSAVSPFRGRCYVAYAVFAGADESDARMAVQTSADGGATWGPQVSIPVDHDPATDVLSPEPVVRPNGELVIVFVERTAVRAVRSTSGGVTFGPRETVASLSQRAYSFAPGRLRGPNIPAVGVDAAGTVYAAWYDCRFRPGCAGNDVVLVRSTGSGWTQPKRIPLGAPGTSEDFLLPALGVDPTASGQRARLALAYYTLSSFDCTGPGCLLSAEFATSLDGGRTWSHGSVGDPMLLDWLAPTAIGRMVGDYVAAVFVPGRAVGVFSLAGPPQAGRFDQAIAATSIALPEPPRNTRRPAVSGAARVGRVVTCLPGSWSGTRPIRFSYRWLHGSRLIPGGTHPLYRIRGTDAGALIACRVDASNAAGSSRAGSSPVRVRRG